MNIPVCGGILSVEDRMLLFTATLAVTLHVAAAPSVAVADLSSSAQPALAEALRKAPGVKGRAQPAAQTAAVVEDAKGLGLACKVDDDACLEKLHVLLRTDELLAFTLERGSVRIARVVTGQPIARAKVRFTAPAGTARAALQALEESGASGASGASSARSASSVSSASDAANNGTADGTGSATAERAPLEGTTGSSERAHAATTATTATASTGGFSPMLVVGVVGGVVTAGCAAGALGTSAHLAALEASGNPAAGDYFAFEGVFNALLVCSAAGVLAAGVGFGLYAMEGESSSSPSEAPEEAATPPAR